MTPGEAEEFERRMEHEPSLRVEMAAYKQALEAMGNWTLAEAPGVDRVEGLPVPDLVSGRQSSLGRGQNGRTIGGPWWFPLPFSGTFAFQGIAATAIFVLGFFIGQQAGLDELQISMPVQSVSGSEKHLGDREVTNKGGQEEPATPVEAAQPVPLPKPAGSRLTKYRPPSHVTDERGRIVFETTMTGTGAQAMWVVDGSFAVEGASRK
jgi:hypothetical protein